MATTVKTFAAPALPVRGPESLWHQALRAFLKQRSAMIGVVLLVLLAFIAIFAPVLAPYDPVQVLIGFENVQKREAPCTHLLGCPADRPQHIMGTDGNVRDEFGRVIYGARG